MIIAWLVLLPFMVTFYLLAALIVSLLPLFSPLARRFFWRTSDSGPRGAVREDRSFQSLRGSGASLPGVDFDMDRKIPFVQMEILEEDHKERFMSNPMSVREMQGFLGKEGRYKSNGFIFNVKLIDVRSDRSATQFLIAPVAGEGQCWVSSHLVTLTESSEG